MKFMEELIIQINKILFKLNIIKSKMKMKMKNLEKNKHLNKFN